MSKLKLLFIASLIMLGVAVSLTIFKPLAKGARYADVQQESLLKSDREWVLQFTLFNNGDSPETFQIQVDKDGQLFPCQVPVVGQEEFTYIRHFQRQPGQDHNLDATIYIQGDNQPVETLHYNLM